MTLWLRNKFDKSMKNGEIANNPTSQNSSAVGRHLVGDQWLQQKNDNPLPNKPLEGQ